MIQFDNILIYNYVKNKWKCVYNIQYMDFYNRKSFKEIILCKYNWVNYKC